MDPFDMSNLGGLIGGFQQRMAQFKEETPKLRAEGVSGGGLVRVVVSGANEVISVTIDEQAMGDRELLEDLVRAATTEAFRSIKEQISAKLRDMTGGLPIPPGLLPF
jgi:nucleoid-associated protein EbfC